MAVVCYTHISALTGKLFLSFFLSFSLPPALTYLGHLLLLILVLLAIALSLVSTRHFQTSLSLCGCKNRRINKRNLSKKKKKEVKEGTVKLFFRSSFL